MTSQTTTSNEPKSEKHASSTTTTSSDDDDILTLPDLRFSYRWRPIILYICFLIFCNVVVPCLLFYLLKNFTGITTKELIGISSAALGLSSCFDAPFRLYRLVRYRRQYGPLGSDVWWHLDFVMWTYTIALMVFAFPLAIAPAISFYNWFLMATMMLVAPVGIVFFLSLLAFELPFWCSSEPPGSYMKPAVFYCIEDVGAVDFMHGREFRRRVHDRYRASPPFRKLMTELTVYWTVSTFVYSGITAAVTWGSPLNFAFGWVLGQFFLWIAASTFGCYFITRRGLKRERAWWSERGTRVIKEGPETSS